VGLARSGANLPENRGQLNTSTERSQSVSNDAGGVGRYANPCGGWVLGAGSAVVRAGYIETEMVSVAKWVAANLPSDALVAAHDIGALGYFDHHQLIDLAGLVTPEVIPFLRDEAQLALYLDQRGADYFIAFPSLYPDLVAQAEILYSTGNPFALALGGENLCVYQWVSNETH
jgi:hypothetical protein